MKLSYIPHIYTFYYYITLLFDVSIFVISLFVCARRLVPEAALGHRVVATLREGVAMEYAPHGQYRSDDKATF